MEAAASYMTLYERLRILRRYRLMMALISVAAAITAFALSARQADEYVATAQLSFSTGTDDVNLVGSFAQQGTTSAQLAAASADTITRPEVIDEVRGRIDTDRTADDLRDLIVATADPASNLVNVEASGPNAAFAANLANTVADVARERAADDARERFRTAAASLRVAFEQLSKADRRTTGVEIQRQLVSAEALARFVSPAEVASPAREPDGPASPKPVRDAILGGIAGLAISLGIALLLVSLDRRLRSSHEIQSELNLPLLGHVRETAMGSVARASDDGVAGGHHDAEAFKILRTNLRFLDVDAPLRTVVITSALPEEGKSTVAASLAMASAAVGSRTLLVECDLRRPCLAERLGLRQDVGLTDYLAGHASPAEILQTVKAHGAESVNGGSPAENENHELVCIAAGTVTPHASELLASSRFAEFLTEVSEAYELVVLDAPPLLPVADTLTLVPLVDRVLLCVRSSRTTRDQALAGKAALDHVSPPPTGLVVTGEKEREELEYGYYHSYAEAPSQTTIA